jgi:hypothetical protein
VGEPVSHLWKYWGIFSLVLLVVIIVVAVVHGVNYNCNP